MAAAEADSDVLFIAMSPVYDGVVSFFLSRDGHQFLWDLKMAWGKWPAEAELICASSKQSPWLRPASFVSEKAFVPGYLSSSAPTAAASMLHRTGAATSCWQ